MDADEVTFSALFERHRRALQAHCYRMVGSFDDAEELVQETFARAWRARKKFRREGRWSFRAWLYRIATNACLEHLARSPRGCCRRMSRQRRTRIPSRARMPATCFGSIRTPTAWSIRTRQPSRARCWRSRS
jgi:RNA polymerase sigma factor (sigma-70 family)